MDLYACVYSGLIVLLIIVVAIAILNSGSH